MKKKLLAGIIACLLVIPLSACGNADTPADQPVVAEGSSEEIPTEPEVTVTGTEYVFENNTHSLVTNYSDGTTETADAEDCTFDESGICTVCSGTIIIPEPVVTEFEEPAEYVVSGIVSTYSKDSVYSLSSEIDSSEEPTIITIVGTTDNGWLVLEDGSFVKPEDAVERTSYEEENGKIYTVTYFDETMELFCQEHSNIRIKPENDAEVAYAKNTNDKVTVVGICNEAEWYLLDDGNWTLKSNLGENEVVVESNNTSNSSTKSCPYPFYVIMYDNMGFPYFYNKGGFMIATMPPEDLEAVRDCQNQCSSYMFFTLGYESCSCVVRTIGDYAEGKVCVNFIQTEDHPGSYLGPEGYYIQIDLQAAYGISTAY